MLPTTRRSVMPRCSWIRTSHYAETGKNIEARDALLRTLDKSRRDQPDSSDWYVLGRMAENYGVREAALAAYKRVDKKENDGASVWELAQRRLAVMGKN